MNHTSKTLTADDYTIQELIDMAKAGNRQARGAAWHQVIEARKAFYERDWKAFRIISGTEGMAKLRATIEWATKELKALDCKA